MAIDPDPPTSPSSLGTKPVIENEILAYRAISGGAVSSLLLGMTSLLCFADYRFLAVAAGAVVLGILARRKISRLPDILTGKKLAEVGIALGLVFGFSSVTIGGVSDLMVNREASLFAQRYVTVLKDEPIANVIWYQQPADFRKTKTPEEILKDLKQTKGGPGKDAYSERTQGVFQIRKRLQGKGEEMHYSKIESKYSDGLTQHVNALIEIDGPGSTEFPAKEEFVLLEMVKAPGAGQNDWMIKELRYPYKPASVVAAPPPKDDDGHGHGH